MILVTPTLRNSFAHAAAHLSTTLQLSQSTQDSRNISTTQTSGRGEGTGRGRGRGGHGRGGGRGRGRGHNIYLGSYTPDKW